MVTARKDGLVVFLVCLSEMPGAALKKKHTKQDFLEAVMIDEAIDTAAVLEKL